MEWTTSRLWFREYALADFPLLLAIDSDSAVTAMRGGTAIIEERYQKQFDAILTSQTITPRQQYHFGLWAQADEQLIGHCFLHITNQRTQEGSLGYFLHPSVWGNGLATEAAMALLEIGFNVLGMHRISAGCIATNPASARVLEKIGMRQEGRLREDRLTDAGERHDTLLYGILRSDDSN